MLIIATSNHITRLIILYNKKLNYYLQHAGEVYILIITCSTRQAKSNFAYSCLGMSEKRRKLSRMIFFFFVSNIHHKLRTEIQLVKMFVF